MIRPFGDGAFSARAPEGLLLARRYGDQALTRSDFTTPEEVNEVYGRRARFFDWTVNAYYLIGFRWWVYRRRAIAALELQPGATIVEIGCGTGLNFRLSAGVDWSQRAVNRGRSVHRYAGAGPPAGRGQRLE
jgi:hypothetical protein